MPLSTPLARAMSSSDAVGQSGHCPHLYVIQQKVGAKKWLEETPPSAEDGKAVLRPTILFREGGGRTRRNSESDVLEQDRPCKCQCSVSGRKYYL